MITNEFERSYVCVQNALSVIDHFDEIIKALQDAGDDGITCAQIGETIFGKVEYQNWQRSYASKIGHALSNLYSIGAVKCKEVPSGKAFEIEVWGYIPNPECPKLKVYDDQGRTFIIDNPNFNGRKTIYGKTTKTIHPTIRVWYWTGLYS